MITYSIFTKNLSVCWKTNQWGAEIHHVFAGANRKKCDKYGYVVPLNPKIHPNGAHFDEAYCLKATGMSRKEFSDYLKVICQKDFEENHGTKEEFREIFGKTYF